jgi:hypothetical protein
MCRRQRRRERSDGMEAAYVLLNRALGAAARSSERFVKHFLGQNAAGAVVDDSERLPPSRCRLNRCVCWAGSSGLPLLERSTRF